MNLKPGSWFVINNDCWLDVIIKGVNKFLFLFQEFVVLTGVPGFFDNFSSVRCNLFQYITLCCFMRCGLTSARPFSDSKKFRETFQFYQLGLINCQTSKSRLQKPKVLTRTDLFFIPIFLQKKSFILPFDYRITCNTDVFIAPSLIYFPW